MAATPATAPPPTVCPPSVGPVAMPGCSASTARSATTALLPAGPTQNADPDGSLLSVGTNGDWLTNSDGQVVILHGLNDVYKVALR